jgi:hypothetical protein
MMFSSIIGSVATTAAVTTIPSVMSVTHKKDTAVTGFRTLVFPLLSGSVYQHDDGHDENNRHNDQHSTQSAPSHVPRLHKVIDND